MVENLKQFLKELKELRKDICDEKVNQIGKKELRDRAERLGSQWFSDFAKPVVQDLGISSQIVDKYSEGCGRLIVLSSPNNLKKSYMETLDSLTKPFRRELILTAQKGQTSGGSIALLHNMLGTLPEPEEN